ncbi:MAG TPA: hypothetical protein VGC41_04855 [Kofleriaceae bacterium]
MRSLSFKAWCETRLRFAIALVAMAAVARLPGDAAPTIYLVLATVLGGGSLRQEAAQHTLFFTLALPVARSHHLVIRAAIAVGEVIALAALAAIMMRSPEVLLRWAPCGVLAMPIALAVSTAVTHEYAAWLLGFGALMAYEVVINMLSLPAPDLYQIMALGSPIPWLALAGLLAAATGVFALGDRMQRWRLV